jgi:hypothetical protein
LRDGRQGRKVGKWLEIKAKTDIVGIMMIRKAMKNKRGVDSQFTIENAR